MKHFIKLSFAGGFAFFFCQKSVIISLAAAVEELLALLSCSVEIENWHSCSTWSNIHLKIK